MSELYTEPLLGWRIWNIASLVPVRMTGVVYTSCLWEPRKPTKAICMKTRNMSSPIVRSWPYDVRFKEMPCENPPMYQCNDGFFGVYNTGLLNKTGLPFSHSLNVVRGCFQAWGKIILHEFGFRAEYVQPVALIDETERTIKRWMPMAYSKLKADEVKTAFLERRTRLEYIAEVYSIPIIGIEDIEEYGRHFGSIPEL